MLRALAITFLAFIVVSFAAPDVIAQDYIIEQTLNGGYNGWIKGQTFTPNIGINPDPGAVTTLSVKEISFFRSSQGWAGPTSHFYLNIYDGDPVNGSGTFIGSSSHSVDVATIGNMDPITWSFDYLTLDYTHEYWALVSSTDTDGGLDVYCGMRECGGDEYTGGNAIAGTSSDPFGFTIKSNDLAFEIVLRLEGYYIDQPVNGGYNGWIKGQTFTPNIGINPDPGTVPAIDLNSITFYRSSQGWAGSTSHFYLNIYDGDPVNGSGAFVGSSSNSVDVSILDNMDPITWAFNNLTLNTTHEYWALVSSTSTDGGLDVYCGMRESGGDEYTGGTAIAGTSSDPFGFTVKTNDLAFVIGLQDTAPSGIVLDIKCNGEDGPVQVTSIDNVTVTVDLLSGNYAGFDVDLWVLAQTLGGKRYSYNQAAATWFYGWMTAYSTGPLSDLTDTVYNSTLPVGSYMFKFGLDLNADGVPSMADLLDYDLVKINVIP